MILFAHTFCFNDQCQTVSGQQLIFLKFKTKIKSESVRKRVYKFGGFGFVKKWRNPSDSKSVTSLHIRVSEQDLRLYVKFLGMV